MPQDTRATEDAAKDLLGGRAASQYAALFGELRQRVAEQKLSLTTHVVRAGVVRLTRDQAELLVFLDQRAQRDGKPATAAAAQLPLRPDSSAATGRSPTCRPVRRRRPAPLVPRTPPTETSSRHTEGAPRTWHA